MIDSRSTNRSTNANTSTNGLFPITVYVESSGGERGGGATIPLPIGYRELDDIFENIGIYGRGRKAFGIYDVRSTVPGLAELLPPDADLEELNYLAERIADMTDCELGILAAEAKARESCGNIEGLVDVADSICGYY